MSGSAWNPGSLVNASTNGAIQSQSFTATDGQTVFALTNFTYTLNANALWIFVNGVRQQLGVDYSETSSSAFTFLSGLVAGDTVVVLGLVQITGQVLDLTTPAFTQPGTGAVLRSPLSKLREVTSIDDYTSLQTAINAVQGSSVYLYITPGNRTATAVNITNSFRMVGAGKYSSFFNWADLNLTFLSAVTDNIVEIEHLGFLGPTGAISGSVISIQGGATENADSSVNNCFFFNGYNHVWTDKCQYFSAEKNYCAENTGACFTIQNSYNIDHGDSVLENNILASAVAGSIGVHYISSGGLRAINNKYNGFDIAFFMNLASGASTGVLLIADSSFEGAATAEIRLKSQGGGAAFNNVVIGDNEFALCAKLIDVPDALPWLKNLNISGCVMTLPGTGGVCVNLEQVQGFYVGSNYLLGNGGTSIGIQVGASAAEGDIGPNKYNNLTTNKSINAGAFTVYSGATVLLASGGTDLTLANTTAETNFLGIVLDPKQIGLTGYVRIRGTFVVTNNANVKTGRIRISTITGTVFWSVPLANVGVCTFDVMINAKGSTAAQRTTAIALTDAPAVLAPVVTDTALDFTTSNVIVITGQKATGTDTFTLAQFSMEMTKS